MVPFPREVALHQSEDLRLVIHNEGNREISSVRHASSQF
jgi:hypothetical protein